MNDKMEIVGQFHEFCEGCIWFDPTKTMYESGNIDLNKRYNIVFCCKNFNVCGDVVERAIRLMKE